jgi:hypothetical protein
MLLSWREADRTTMMILIMRDEDFCHGIWMMKYKIRLTIFLLSCWFYQFICCWGSATFTD